MDPGQLNRLVKELEKGIVVRDGGVNTRNLQLKAAC